MIIYFANRTMTILGQASTGLPEGLRIREDVKEEDVDSGIATFSCKIAYDKDTRELAENCTAPGNYILRSNDSENEFYTIIESELDTEDQTIYLYAEDAGLDLINEVCEEWSDDTEYSLAEFIEKWTYDSGFEIGVDESSSSVKMAVTGREEETATERILYIAGEFGYEIGFSFTIENLKVTHKYIDIYKERGKEVEALLKLNRDVKKITITKSVANLATALLVTGATPDNSDIPVTLEGYEYDDGDFYVDSHKVKSRSALAKWSRYVNPDEPNQIDNVGHIVKTFTYDTLDQEELLNQAIEQLKSIYDTEVNYECEITHLPDGIKIGDRMNLVDEAGKLYLSTRILKLSTSIVDNTRTATLGEYIIKDSGISAQVQELAKQFSSLAASRTFYTWIAYADDAEGNGISLDSTDKAYVGISANHLTEEVDISDPSIFTWSLIQGSGTGVEEINYYYGVSDSSTEQPTEWSTETPSTDSNNAYIWTYTETIYTDGSSQTTTPYVITYYGFLKVDELEADVATIKEAYITYADIEDLEADVATIKTAYITTGDIETLLADKAYITEAEVETLIAEQGYITSLEVDDLLADYVKTTELEASVAKLGYLEADFSNIDEANIDVAAVGTLFADVGLITDMTVEDAKITGTLSSVTINADTITAGTLSVDRLLLTGEDGLIYEINATSSGLTETELTDEVYQTYLNGTVIVANSITADQIAASTITSTEIAANTIEADNIKAGTITSTEIAAGTIKAYNINVDDLESNLVRVGDTSGRYVRIDDDSVDICNEDTVLASFGETTTIGKIYQNRMILTDNSLTLIDKDNTEYFFAGDKRGEYCYEVLEGEVFIKTAVQKDSDGNYYVTLSKIPEAISSVMQGDTEIEYEWDGGTEVYLTGYSSTSSDNVSVDFAIYEDVHCYTFGTRNELTYGSYSAVIGYNCEASGECSVAIGHNTVASDLCAYAEGKDTVASNNNAHAEGNSTTASGKASHAEGGGTEASGEQAHAEGESTVASGDYSHVEGYGAKANSNYAHAEGRNTTASGLQSHAEGYNTTASGSSGHAEGSGSTASNTGAHAEGYGTTASGTYSHAEGRNTTASGNYGSHAEGNQTTASALYSHAEGMYTLASSNCQHVFGKYNIEDADSVYAEIVGNGTGTSARSNARTLDWDGNEVLAGNLTCANVGTYYSDSQTITCSSGGVDSYTSGGTLTLSAGTYVVVATGSFTTNSTATQRRVNMYNSTTSQSIGTTVCYSNGYASADVVRILQLTTDTTIICRLSTGIGATLSSCVGMLRAVQIA